MQNTCKEIETGFKKFRNILLRILISTSPLYRQLISDSSALMIKSILFQNKRIEGEFMGDDIYRTLRKHLDKMPVGYPATRSGVELRILKRLFAPTEAEAALALTHRFEPIDPIAVRASRNGFQKDRLKPLLTQMAKKGSILTKTIAGSPHYALVPFVIGMFEFQLHHLSKEMYEDTAQYFKEAFGLAYLSTAVPQMRVIPVEESVSADHHVATYDEIRRVIKNADGRIGVADCICRTGKDLIGEPCKKTDRRSLCFGFRDYYDTYKREGWFREVSEKEALDILKTSEKEGLILQATNEQEPQAVCACCGCCCGILSMLKAIPNGADFVAGNYRAQVEAETCIGCGLCVDRCHMGAIVLTEKRAGIDPGRCIGCGVCVPACKPGALRLVKKERECVPPQTTEDLYETILLRKRRWAGLRTGLKILRHMNIKEIRELLDI